MRSSQGGSWTMGRILRLFARDAVRAVFSPSPESHSLDYTLRITRTRVERAGPVARPLCMVLPPKTTITRGRERKERWLQERKAWSRACGAWMLANEAMQAVYQHCTDNEVFPPPRLRLPYYRTGRRPVDWQYFTDPMLPGSSWVENEWRIFEL